MFSLVVTVIAVALVVLLAIATIYYGATAALNRNADIKATTLTNQATQLYGAALMFYTENGCWADTPSQLTGRDPSNVLCTGKPNTVAYLSSLPEVPAMAQAEFSLVSSAYAASPEYWSFLLDGNGKLAFINLPDKVGAPVCSAVQRAIKRDTGIKALLNGKLDNIQTAFDPKLQYQCVNDSGAATTDAGKYSYFWVAPGADACSALAQYNQKFQGASIPKALTCAGSTEPPPVTPPAPTLPKYTCINQNPFIDANSAVNQWGSTGVNLLIEGPNVDAEFSNLTVVGSGPNTITSSFSNISIGWAYSSGSRSFFLGLYPAAHAPTDNAPYVITGASGVQVTCDQTIVPTFSNVNGSLDIEVNPDSGPRTGGYPVTINATYGSTFNLGPQGQKPVIQWGMKTLPSSAVTVVNNTTLTVTAPSIEEAGGDYSSQSGAIVVQNYGEPNSAWGWFYYDNPVASMTPTHGFKDTAITFTGAFPAKPKVTFKQYYQSDSGWAQDVKTATITRNDASTIVVPAPEVLNLGAYYISITDADESVSYTDGSLTFTYDQAPKATKMSQVATNSPYVPVAPDYVSKGFPYGEPYAYVDGNGYTHPGWADLGGTTELVGYNRQRVEFNSAIALQLGSDVSVTVGGVPGTVVSVIPAWNAITFDPPPMATPGVKNVEVTVDGVAIPSMSLSYSNVKVTGLSFSDVYTSSYKDVTTPDLVITGSGFNPGSSVHLEVDTGALPYQQGAINSTYPYCNFDSSLITISPDGTRITIPASAFGVSYVRSYGCDRVPDGATARIRVESPQLVVNTLPVYGHNVSSPTFRVHPGSNGTATYAQVALRGVKSVNPTASNQVVFSTGMSAACQGQSTIDAQNSCWAAEMTSALGASSCSVTKTTQGVPVGYAQQMVMTCLQPKVNNTDAYNWQGLGLTPSTDVVITQ